MNPILFGTDGWRGIISREVTFETMARVARAVGRIVGPEGRVVVGHDTRFLSRQYAEVVASSLAGTGPSVLLSLDFCPSPALSFQVPYAQADLGLMITASHNPPIYNGLKIKGPEGGPAPRQLVERVSEICKAHDHCRETPTGTPGQADFSSQYVEALRGFLQPDHFARIPSGEIVVDAFHGSGAGYMPRILGQLGREATEIRGDMNPGFGGVSPEPGVKNSHLLGRAVKERGALVGFQFDGDADRLAAWEEPHGFIHPQHVFLLLVEHLSTGRGWKGRVVRTSAVSSLVDRLVQARGLEICHEPVGFGNVSRRMIEGNVLIGGEEAGGIGIGRHIPDRDAPLGALLLLEMIGQRGEPLSAILEGLFSELGRLHFDRVDVPVEGMSPSVLLGLREHVPARLSGLEVLEVDTRDGLRIDLEEGAWILFRASGTEPLVRVYSEAPTPALLKSLLQEGVSLSRAVV